MGVLKFHMKRLFLLITTLSICSMYILTKYPHFLHERQLSGDSVKTILSWSGKGSERNIRCNKKHSCFVTQNREMKKIEDFDAVVFHHYYHSNLSDLPVKRKPEQLYIYYNIESPAITQILLQDFNSLAKYFNLSMTYRLTADISHRYGRFIPLAPHPAYRHGLERVMRDFSVANSGLARRLRGKSDEEVLAAQFVTKCSSPSKREDLVSSLSQLMKVDIYGKCGRLDCPKRDEACYIKMSQTYKFYLSFENSLCEDYVTEKFFKILRYNVIPVVFNGANMSAIAPPHSYINAEDFSSVEQLAEFLLMIGRNDTLFTSYFWWRDYYKIQSPRHARRQAWCDLCKYLHQGGGRSQSQSQHGKQFDLQKHLDIATNCRKGTF